MAASDKAPQKKRVAVRCGQANAALYLADGTDGPARHPYQPTFANFPIPLFPALLFHQVAQLAFHRFKSVVNYLGQSFVRTVVRLCLVRH